MTVENNETPSAFGVGGAMTTASASVSAPSEDIVELRRRRESTSATTEGSQSQVRRVLLTQVYRVSHLLVDLGWVDFDLGVPPSCSAAQPLLKNFRQPR